MGFLFSFSFFHMFLDFIFYLLSNLLNVLGFEELDNNIIIYNTPVFIVSLARKKKNRPKLLAILTRCPSVPYFI